MLRIRRLRGSARSPLAARSLALAPSSRLPPPPADEATIAYVEAEPTTALQILVSVPAGRRGRPGRRRGHHRRRGRRRRRASLAEYRRPTIRRTTVLAIDTSNSMTGERFEAAKAAALTFLDTVPDDVYVGIVTFDSDVETPLAPTQDRDAARAVIEGLDAGQADPALRRRARSRRHGRRRGPAPRAGALRRRGHQPTPSWPTSPPRSATSDVLVDVVALEQDGPGPRRRWSRWPRPAAGR